MFRQHFGSFAQAADTKAVCRLTEANRPVETGNTQVRKIRRRYTRRYITLNAGTVG